MYGCGNVEGVGMVIGGVCYKVNFEIYGVFREMFSCFFLGIYYVCSLMCVVRVKFFFMVVVFNWGYF